MRKTIWIVMGLLMLAMTQSAMAAKRLEPPIEQLQSVPERISIAIAWARGKSESGKVKFAVSEKLSGEAPDEVLLRVDPDSAADVEVGGSYILAFTFQRRNRAIPAGYEKDPNGPYVVQLLGIGTKALFADTPHTRFLFAPGNIGDPAKAGPLLDALLSQLQREDFRSRGLVITELMLREDLTEQIGPEQAGIIREVLQGQTLDPQHHDFLLRTTMRLPANLTSPWLAEECRRIIIRYGTHYDLSSFIPGLVRTAARGLQQAGEPADVDLLETLLYSNNPGVSKAALAAMDQLDRAATIEKAEQAMGRGWIHSETGSALRRYLNQAGVATSAD